MASIPCMCTYYKKQEGVRKKNHLISQIVCPSTVAFRPLDLDLDQLTESDIQKSSSSIMCDFHLWWNASTNRFVSEKALLPASPTPGRWPPKMPAFGSKVKAPKILSNCGWRLTVHDYHNYIDPFWTPITPTSNSKLWSSALCTEVSRIPRPRHFGRVLRTYLRAFI